MAYRGAKVWNGSGWDDVGDPRVADLLSRTVAIESAKGSANGYASLDSSSRLPAGQLPTTAEVTGNKGLANGYAGLDSSSNVPFVNLPTGTGSNNVAVGNHTHTASSLTGPGRVFVTRLTTTENRTSTTTTSNTALVLSGLPANTSFGLQGFFYASAIAAADLRFLFLPSTALTDSVWNAGGVNASNTAALTASPRDFTTTAMTASQDVAGYGSLTIYNPSGSFTTGNAVTSLTLRMAQATSSTTASSLLAGSWLMAVQLT